MENQNPVSQTFYQFIQSKVSTAEKELNGLHEEIRQLTDIDNLGDEYDSQPELSLEWQLQAALRRAKELFRSCLVVPDPTDNSEVQIGSRVEIVCDKHRQIIRLEGVSGRSDVCSLQTLLGRTIIGAKTGDKFMIGGRKVKIIKIFL